jgi:hypothetical protein
MPPDIRDWLPEGHFAWFVLDAVADMNLGEFYWAYRRDGVGRRAYDPAMMACGPLASGVCGSRYAWGGLVGESILQAGISPEPRVTSSAGTTLCWGFPSSPSIRANASSAPSSPIR